MKKQMLSNNNKILNISWLPWVLIIMEMLYMAGPFAVFFYSAYQLPLKLLNRTKVGSWMVQTIFPHFVEIKSPVMNIAMHLAWVVMGIALLVFLASFFQIYYAKFTKKGAVTGGIYRFIRHPQYTAWIVFGFAMCIVWSRLIVWLMFITMAFVYYFLAKTEERECMEKYPSYSDYYNSTGMFFPSFMKGKSSISIFSWKGSIGKVSVVVLYLFILLVVTGLSRGVRSWSISQMATFSGDGYMALSLTYIDEDRLRQITEIVFDDETVKNELAKIDKEDKLILYIMPRNWFVSELGMEADYVSGRSGDDPHANPGSHGNPADTEPMKKKVLISKALLHNQQISDNVILHNMTGHKPLLIVNLDITKGKAISVEKAPARGLYGDIPVPFF